MATRLWQSGWELNTLSEGNSAAGATLPVISTTKAYTGTYSLRQTTNSVGYGVVISASTELRAACMINHNGLGTNARPTIFRMVASDATVFSVEWQQSTGNLRLMQGSTELAAVVAAGTGFTPTNVWYSCSVAFKVDASAGWFNFYIDGVEILTFGGNTGTSGIVAVQFGGGSGNNWSVYAYFDDCYIDDTTGEAAAAASTRRFLWGVADGNGVASNWVGSDGNSTDNYLLVDDTTPDSDTTYVVATAAATHDSYTCAAVTVPADYAVRAVIPTALARKTDAGTDSELTMRLAKSGSDDDGTAQDLTTAYGVAWARFTALPDASALTEANVNACEVGIVSAGSY